MASHRSKQEKKGGPLQSRSAIWGIKSKAIEALAFRAQRFSVGLGPPNAVMHRGEYVFASGVLISCKERTFIATAGHFLDQVSHDQVHVLFSANKGFGVSTSNVEHKDRLLKDPESTIGLSKPINARSFMRSEDHSLDICVLEIRRNLIPNWCEVYSLDGEGVPEARRDTMTMMVAMPASSSAIREGISLPLIRRGWACLGARIDEPEPRKWDSWNDRFSLQLSLDAKGAQIGRTMGFFGYSGSGVWRVNPASRAEKDLWLPSLELLGIQIGHRAQSGKLQATRIGAVLELVKSRYTS